MNTNHERRLQVENRFNEQIWKMPRAEFKALLRSSKNYTEAFLSIKEIMRRYDFNYKKSFKSWFDTEGNLCHMYIGDDIEI